MTKALQMPKPLGEMFKLPASLAETHKALQPSMALAEMFKPLELPASLAEMFKPSMALAEMFKPFELPASLAEMFKPSMALAEMFKPLELPASLAEMFKPSMALAEMFKPLELPASLAKTLEAIQLPNGRWSDALSELQPPEALAASSALFDVAQAIHRISGQGTFTRRDEWQAFTPEAQAKTVIATHLLLQQADGAMDSDGDKVTLARGWLVRAWLLTVAAWIQATYRVARDSKDIPFILPFIVAALPYAFPPQPASDPVLKDILSELRKAPANDHALPTQPQPSSASAPLGAPSPGLVNALLNEQSVRVMRYDAVLRYAPRPNARSMARLSKDTIVILLPDSQSKWRKVLKMETTGAVEGWVHKRTLRKLGRLGLKRPPRSPRR